MSSSSDNVRLIRRRKSDEQKRDEIEELLDHQLEELREVWCVSVETWPKGTANLGAAKEIRDVLRQQAELRGMLVQRSDVRVTDASPARALTPREALATVDRMRADLVERASEGKP